MKKLIVTIFIFALTISLNGQTKKTESNLNLDFEQVINGTPEGWKSFGNAEYDAFLDSVSVRNGKYSGFIGFNEGKTGFKQWLYILPDNYKGTSITLSGYIKTENIIDGFAGLYMRIDPEIALNDMYQQGIKGSTDWTEYKITLKLNPERTKQVVVGGWMRGKGKMWIDDLKITIDGKDISKAKIFQRKIYPAEIDTTFDKGSNIIFPELDNKKVDNLELLGKLWGFLKYHHPEVAKGNYNWDYELFRMLPEYLKVTDNKQRDQLLLSWINKYGDIPICKTCKKTPSNAFLKPDFSWMVNSNADKKLKKKVKEIYQNRHQGKKYYIGGMVPLFGKPNPEFLNENSYSNMPYPDAGFRLLALYRYWNMIQYFFPYRHLTDKDWNSVLREYIPKFINASDQLEYEFTVLQTITEIDDTHAAYLGGNNKIQESRGVNYPSFVVKFIENKLVVTDYYNPEFQDSSALQIGDVITHISGKPVELIVDSLKIYYPASNEAAKLRLISWDMLRSNQSFVDIQYISYFETRIKSIKLYTNDRLNLYNYYTKKESEKCYKLLDENIGYIFLKSIKDEDIPIIKEIFKHTKGIIIDIRDGLSNYHSTLLETYFFSENTPYVKFSYGNVNNPGEFRTLTQYSVPKSNDYYQGKLVVLVNERVQSAGETQTMAFQASPNTIIVGSTTAGANGNVSTMYLPGGLSTSISGIGVYYPDGTVMQRVGIVPDVYVEPTIEGIKNGRDEVLEKAIEVINKQ